MSGPGDELATSAADDALDDAAALEAEPLDDGTDWLKQGDEEQGASDG